MKNKKILFILPTILSITSLMGCNKKQFKIKWTNYDDSILKEETLNEGEMPVYSGIVPTKPADEENVYVFSSWDKEIVKVSADTTYKATYNTYVKTEDSDFDGIPNGLDKEPNNNTFKNVKLGRGDSFDMRSDLTINFSWFVDLDNKVYHNEIAKFGVYFSQDNPTFEDEIKGIDNHSLYQRTFTDDVISIDMESSWFEENTHDIIGCRLAHKLIKKDGKNYDIILMNIKGTRNSDEWISNFDVGYDHNDYYSKSGVSPTDKNWTNKKLHKGFGVAANRFLNGDGEKKIPISAKSYVDKYSKNGNEPILFIFGHSRGAAAATILGEYFENKYRTPDEKRLKTFTYAFASPTVHDKEDLPKTETVFNIINTDDFVTMVPLEQWGLSRIGKDVLVKSVRDSYAKEYKNATGVEYENLKDIGSVLTKLVGNRNELYNADTNRDANLASTDQVHMKEAVDYRIMDIKQKIQEFLKLPLNYFNIVDDRVTRTEAPYTIKVYNCKATLLAIVANVLSNKYTFESVTDILNFISGCTLVLNDVYVAALMEFVTKTGFIGDDLQLHLDTVVKPHDLCSYLVIVDNYNK